MRTEKDKKSFRVIKRRRQKGQDELKGWKVFSCVTKPEEILKVTGQIDEWMPSQENSGWYAIWLKVNLKLPWEWKANDVIWLFIRKNWWNFFSNRWRGWISSDYQLNKKIFLIFHLNICSPLPIGFAAERKGWKTKVDEPMRSKDSSSINIIREISNETSWSAITDVHTLSARGNFFISRFNERFYLDIIKKFVIDVYAAIATCSLLWFCWKTSGSLLMTIKHLKFHFTTRTFAQNHLRRHNDSSLNNKIFH